MEKIEGVGTEIQIKNDDLKNSNRNIGGVLVFFVIILFVSTLSTSYYVYSRYIVGYFNGSLNQLFIQGTKYYNFMWFPVYVYELVFLTVFVIISIYLIALFIKRKKKFPKFIIAFLILQAFYNILDYIFSIIIIKSGTYTNSPDLTIIIKPLISCAIWIPYFKKSKRVKETFINL